MAGSNEPINLASTSIAIEVYGCTVPMIIEMPPLDGVCGATWVKKAYALVTFIAKAWLDDAIRTCDTKLDH